jgi:lipoprotein NlpI
MNRFPWVVALGFGLWLALVAANHVQAEDAAEALVRMGIEQAEAREYSSALDAYDRAIKQSPESAQAYYWRGRTYFCLGKVKQAVADFDRYLELAPRAASRQWERGIAQYYAGDYAGGAKQFELYQTYHDNDVENSVWRYLCVARDKNVAEAQKTMLPIENDTRVPMMQIYDLYRGKLKPEDVLAAAKAGDPSEAAKNARLFYAYLYIGLWHEAAGEPKLAAEHLQKAELHKIGHYMWDVARVHNELR